jgi:hypothetical protein
MRFLKERSGWAVPAALSVTLVAALLISPAIGGPRFVTGKKVVKTITKKTNASQVVSPQPKPLGTTELVLASLELSPGNYVVSSTFDVTRLTSALVNCHLRIVGVSQDSYSSFHEAPAGIEQQEGAAMETAGRVGSPTQAQLICSSSILPASVRNAEITATKVPKLTVTSG